VYTAPGESILFAMATPEDEKNKNVTAKSKGFIRMLKLL
jgi:hypothetical protein